MLTIERRPLSSLVPNPKNARTHDARNLEAIKSSLLQFGQAEPLILQKSSQQLIGGNGRREAMLQLGWTEADVVELDVNDASAAALGVALNRTSELASWDTTILEDLLQQIERDGLRDAVSFTDEDFKTLLSQLENDKEPRQIEDPGPGEPPVTPVSRTGDLWLLGSHRLLCGNSTNVADVERLLNGAVPKLFSSDPPYCVDYDGNNRPIHDGKRSGKDWSHVYREVDIEDLTKFLTGVFNAYLPRIDVSAPFYIWHAHLQQTKIAEVFAKFNVLFHQVIVWCKPTPVFTHCYYQWQHEVCAFGWIKGNKPTHGIAQHSTVWHVDWEGKQRIVGNEHPTQKPVRLFTLPMELHTQPGDVVVEPFSGSGSQIIGAEMLQRKCYAMELQPAFVDVAIKRWELATNQKATLDGDGRAFEEIATERLP
ncbi:MAG: DNA modification methylase [Planctomycetota bacterium]